MVYFRAHRAGVVADGKWSGGGEQASTPAKVNLTPSGERPDVIRSSDGGVKGGVMAHTVLVVDDHPPTVQLVRTALEGLGMEIRTASNGAEGLLAVNEEKPDLIILDVMMPVLDGFQTLEILQQSEETDKIPVIMLTARSSDRDVAHGWRSGVTSYLTKPFSIDQLVALVQRILESTANIA